MSSLLQFTGRVDKKGVHIQAYVESDPDYICKTCGKGHKPLYVFARKPVDMWGCWVRFRINGELRAPDLSVPMVVDPNNTYDLKKLPRDAVKLSEEESSKLWHS